MHYPSIFSPLWNCCTFNIFCFVHLMIKLDDNIIQQNKACIEKEIIFIYMTIISYFLYYSARSFFKYVWGYKIIAARLSECPMTKIFNNYTGFFLLDNAIIPRHLQMHKAENIGSTTTNFLKKGFWTWQDVVNIKIIYKYKMMW